MVINTGPQASCDVGMRGPGVMTVGLIVIYFLRCGARLSLACLTGGTRARKWGSVHLSWEYHFVHVLQLEIDTNMTNKAKSRLLDRLGGIDLRQNSSDAAQLGIKKHGPLRSAN